MSGRCTGWVLKEGPQDRAMRAVLIVIADAANADGEHSHPGLDNIMAGSLYGRSTVLATLDRLRKEGWIQVVSRNAPGRSTVYHVNMDPRIRKSQLERAVDKPATGPAVGPVADGDRSNPEGEQVQSEADDTSSSFSQRFTQRDGSDSEAVDNEDDDLVERVAVPKFDRTAIDNAKADMHRARRERVS